MYVSFDDGRTWQSIQKNLPPVPVHDITIKDNDVIAATHGRSFWVHRRHLAAAADQRRRSRQRRRTCSVPSTRIRTQWGGGFGGGGGGGGSTVGANPPSGAVIYYSLKTPNQKVNLEFTTQPGR